MSWSNRYVGIPFRDLGRDRSGVDCWGLAWLIYRDVLGITLPEYLNYPSADEQAEVSAVIIGATSSPIWQQVIGPPQPFDIALFRRGRLTTHVGVVIRPGLVIHVEGEDCAKLADYRSGAWGQRLAGHYRHVSKPVEGGVK